MIAGDSEGIGMVNGIGYKHLINKILNPQFVDTKYFLLNIFQHWISFIGPLMIVKDGRSNSSELDASMVEIYDTESLDWHKFKAINRYLQTIVSIDNYLYVHGGFEPEFPNKPLDTML